MPDASAEPPEHPHDRAQDERGDGPGPCGTEHRLGGRHRGRNRLSRWARRDMCATALTAANHAANVRSTYADCRQVFPLMPAVARGLRKPVGQPCRCRQDCERSYEVDSRSYVSIYAELQYRSAQNVRENLARPTAGIRKISARHHGPNRQDLVDRRKDSDKAVKGTARQATGAGAKSPASAAANPATGGPASIAATKGARPGQRTTRQGTRSGTIAAQEKGHDNGEQQGGERNK